MAGFTVAAENAAVAGVIAEGNWISLHENDPGDTGTSEIATGDYVRVSVTWGLVTNSAVTSDTAAVLNVPAGTTITHWGLWSLETGGTFLYGGSLAAPESFGSNGTYSLTPTLSASD